MEAPSTGRAGGPAAALVSPRLAIYAQGSPRMSEPLLDIVVLERPIDRAVLARLVGAYFAGMVKYVVDIRRRVVALGGELHADGAAILLEQGSRHEDIRGANYYPGRGSQGCIEYTSLISIRPASGNRAMRIQDDAVREAVRAITFELIKRGEEC